MDRDYLNYCIKKEGRTQQELADYLGITVVTLQCKMRGRIRWSLEDIRQIKEFLVLSNEDVERIWGI